MNDIKYTNDGKKVSVIGKINKTEFIVQEIFITESGDEIPSGENFTAKSLHDTPVKSWKDREIEKIESRYDKAKLEISSIEKEVRQMRAERSAHAKIISSNLRQIKELENLDLGLLPDVMARNIKWICSTGYDWSNVKSFDEFIMIRSNYDEGIKLISVHSKSNEGLQYKVGSYSDGSGNNHEYKFFNSKDDLATYLKEMFDKYIEEDRLTLSMFDQASRFVDLPKDKRDELVAKEIKSANKRYEESLKRITDERDRTLNNHNN